MLHSTKKDIDSLQATILTTMQFQMYNYKAYYTYLVKV